MTVISSRLALTGLCAATLVTCTLAACTPTPAIHRGLSPDGYSTTTNSPHLPPPADLMQPARRAAPLPS